MATKPAYVAMDLEAVEASTTEDVRRALQRLRGAKVPAVVVSLEGTDRANARLAAMGLAKDLTRIESLWGQADRLDEPAVHDLVRRLGVPIDQFAVVTAVPDRSFAARNAGATAVLLQRNPKTFVHDPGPADLQAPDFGAAVDQLLALPPEYRPPAGL